MKHSAQVRTLHARAQEAMLERMIELAGAADTEELRGLTDAYMALPRPGEDDFDALPLPDMPSDDDEPS